MSYPERIPKGLRTAEIEARMLEQLRLCGIEYLVERNQAVGGLDAKLAWEDVLSLGEQQRLSLTRLFYHVPRFAVLDECTSAVSADIEQRLYAAAHEKNITCVTISQRIALEEFHDAELKLGTGNSDGWIYREKRIHNQQPDWIQIEP